MTTEKNGINGELATRINETVLVRINDETPVGITPKPGNYWTGKDLYGHLHILGWDIEDDDMVANSDVVEVEGQPFFDYKWTRADGTKVEALVPLELNEMLLDYDEGYESVIEKLERQTEQCGPELPTEDLEAKRKCNDGRKPEDLEF